MPSQRSGIRESLRGIPNLDQGQALGRGRHAQHPPVAGLQRFPESVRFQPVQPDLDQCPGNNPDHVVQKSVP